MKINKSKTELNEITENLNKLKNDKSKLEGKFNIFYFYANPLNPSNSPLYP